MIIGEISIVDWYEAVYCPEHPLYVENEACYFWKLAVADDYEGSDRADDDLKHIDVWSCFVCEFLVVVALLTFTVLFLFSLCLVY